MKAMRAKKTTTMKVTKAVQAKRVSVFAKGKMARVAASAAMVPVTPATKLTPPATWSWRTPKGRPAPGGVKAAAMKAMKAKRTATMGVMEAGLMQLATRAAVLLIPVGG